MSKIAASLAESAAKVGVPLKQFLLSNFTDNSADILSSLNAQDIELWNQGKVEQISPEGWGIVERALAADMPQLTTTEALQKKAEGPTIDKPKEDSTSYFDSLKSTLRGVGARNTFAKTGQVVGGLVGARAGKTPAASAATALAGRVALSPIDEMLYRLGAPEGQRKPSLGEQFGGVASNAAEQAKTGAIEEGVGLLGGKLLDKLSPGMKLSPNAQNLRSLADAKGLPYTPANVLDKPAQIAEEQTMRQFAPQAFEDIGMAQNKRVNELVGEAQQQFGRGEKTTTEAGLDFAQGVKARENQLQQEAFAPGFRKMVEQGKGMLGVATNTGKKIEELNQEFGLPEAAKKMVQKVQNNLSQADRAGYLDKIVESNRAFIRAYYPESQQFKEDLLKNVATFSDLVKLKRELASTLDSKDFSEVGSQAAGATKSLLGSIQADMDGIARQYSDEFADYAVKLAEDWERFKTTTNSDTIQSIKYMAEWAPEKMWKKVQSPTTWKKLSNVYGEDTMAPLRKEAIESVFDASVTRDATGNIVYTGPKMKDYMDKNMELLKTALKPEEFSALYDIAKLSNISTWGAELANPIKSANKFGMSQGFETQMRQIGLSSVVGAAAGAASGDPSMGVLAGAAAAFTTPQLMKVWPKLQAEMITNPKLRNIYIDGVKMGMGPREILKAAGRVGVQKLEDDRVE